VRSADNEEKENENTHKLNPHGQDGWMDGWEAPPHRPGWPLRGAAHQAVVLGRPKNGFPLFYSFFFCYFLFFLFCSFFSIFVFFKNF
jgi:hypothetical protein